jgi:hypothetical protein
VRGQLRRQVDERSTQAGEQVSSTAADVRGVAQHLREQGKARPAKLAEQAADCVERVGSYLERADGEAILRDIEGFGRKQPWAVMAGGLAVGFLASRFLKASSSRRAETGHEPPDRPTSGNGVPPRTDGFPGAAAVPPAPSTPAAPPAATPRVPGSRESMHEPGPSRGAEPASLTGGVLSPETSGAAGPGDTR